MRRGKKEEASLLSSIHLIDHSFVSQLIGKYGWSIQNNAPRSNLKFLEEAGQGAVHITEHSTRIEIKQIIQPLHLQLIYRSAELLALAQARVQGLSSLLKQIEHKDQMQEAFMQKGDGQDALKLSKHASNKRYIAAPNKLKAAPFSASYPLLHRIEQERVASSKKEANQLFLQQLSSPSFTDAAGYEAMLNRIQSMTSNNSAEAATHNAPSVQDSSKASSNHANNQASLENQEKVAITVSWSKQVQQTLETVQERLSMSGTATSQLASEKNVVHRKKAVLQQTDNKKSLTSSARLLTSSLSNAMTSPMSMASSTRLLRTLHSALMLGKQQLVINRHHNEPLRLIYRADKESSSLHERKVSQVHHKDEASHRFSRALRRVHELQMKQEQSKASKSLSWQIIAAAQELRSTAAIGKTAIKDKVLPNRFINRMRAQLMADHSLSQMQPLPKRVSERQMIELRNWKNRLHEQGEQILSLWTKAEQKQDTPIMNIRLVHRRLSELEHNKALRSSSQQQVERHEHKSQFNGAGRNALDNSSMVTSKVTANSFLSKRINVERVLQQYVEAKKRQDILVYNRQPANVELASSNRHITILSVAPVRMMKHMENRHLILKQQFGMMLHTDYAIARANSAHFMGNQFLKLYYRPADVGEIVKNNDGRKTDSKPVRASIAVPGVPLGQHVKGSLSAETEAELKIKKQILRTRLLQTTLGDLSLLNKLPAIADQRRLAQNERTVQQVLEVQRSQLQLHREQQSIHQTDSRARSLTQQRAEMLHNLQEIRWQQEKNNAARQTVAQQTAALQSSTQQTAAQKQEAAQLQQDLQSVSLQVTIQNKLGKLVQLKNLVLSSSALRLAGVGLKHRMGQSATDQKSTRSVRMSSLSKNSSTRLKGMLSPNVMVTHARLKSNQAAEGALVRVEPVGAALTVLAQQRSNSKLKRGASTLLEQKSPAGSLRSASTVAVAQAHIRPLQSMVTTMTLRDRIQNKHSKPSQAKRQSTLLSKTTSLSLLHGDMLSQSSHMLTSTMAAQVSHRNEPSARLDVKKEIKSSSSEQGLQQLKQSVQVLEQRLKEQQDKLVKQNPEVSTRQLVDQLYDELTRKLRMEAKRYGR